MGNPIRESLSKLTKYFSNFNIPYVIVGGVAVLVFGRTRLTNDIDIIVDHNKIDRPNFVNYLRSVGFDANLSDFISFDEGLHCKIFLKQGMFRIDIMGNYTEKENESIERAIEMDFGGFKVKIDHPESIVLNKLIFGSEQDYEDALAVFVRNIDIINEEKLRLNSQKYGIFEPMDALIAEVEGFLNRKNKENAVD